jgi:hypothetical protein
VVRRFPVEAIRTVRRRSNATYLQWFVKFRSRCLGRTLNLLFIDKDTVVMPRVSENDEADLTERSSRGMLWK